MQDQDVTKLIARQADRYVGYAESVAREIAKREVNAAITERQQAEDHRAVRRNRNRSLTLFVALGMFFIVPPIMQAVGLAAYLVYAPVIAIFPDALITLYAYIKKL